MLEISPGRPYEVESLKYDFRPVAGDPRRVFHVMDGLVETCSILDGRLAETLDPSIEVQWTLVYLETGSLVAFFRRVLQQKNDTYLGKDDWERATGKYLKEGKRKLFQWMGKRDTVQSRAELKQLQSELHSLARRTEVAPLDSASPMKLDKLADSLTMLSATVADVQPGEAIIYDPSGRHPLTVNTAFHFPKSQADHLLTDSFHTSESDETLTVRRPDLVGETQWEFLLRGEPIKAQILDRAWWKRFHAGAAPLVPGSALRVRLRTETTIGPDGQSLSIKRFIQQVYDVPLHKDAA